MIISSNAFLNEYQQFSDFSITETRLFLNFVPLQSWDFDMLLLNLRVKFTAAALNVGTRIIFEDMIR